MKKVLLICNSSGQVLNFRADLIKTLLENNFEVHCVVGDEENEDKTALLNIKRFNVIINNASLNLLKAVSYKNKIAKIVKENNYDAVMTFMLKPNIFGVKGAVKGGAKNIYCFVEGMGRAFSREGFINKLLRRLIIRFYKKSFKHAKTVFVLNNADKKLIQEKVCKNDINKVIQINGIGLDINHYKFSEPECKDTFLMVSRLLYDKGVTEYIKAAELVKQDYPNAKFYLVGSEGELSVKDIQQYIDSNIIEYLPPVQNIIPILNNCNTYVLPSYREGMSRSIMEAMATGRAIITTTAPGCDDAVEEGINGYKVPIKDINALAEAMRKMLDNPVKCSEMGKESRRIAEEKFDSKIINDKIFFKFRDCMNIKI